MLPQSNMKVSNEKVNNIAPAYTKSA